MGLGKATELHLDSTDKNNARCINNCLRRLLKRNTRARGHLLALLWAMVYIYIYI